MMDKQRSFPLKPTRFLVFSFTISSSIIFLTFFTLWVFKSTVSVPLQSTLSVALNNPINAHTFSFNGSNRNFTAENSTSFITHFQKPENHFGFLERKANKSRVIEIEAADEKTEIPRSEMIEDKKVRATSFNKIVVKNNETVEKKSVRECDVWKGRWVYDETYPLYRNSSCPFIDEGFNCEANGRSDKDYMKWRWQPQDCDIPRFNATKMLDLIRGKRLVFVGDSVNRNQWESMLCMLMTAVRDPRKVYETHRRRITKEKGNYSFKFVDYKCTVEYYVTHFLVHESKSRVGQKRVPTLRIDTIDHGSSRWRGADIVVFNTAHWWNHYKTKSGINYYQENGQVYPRLDVSTAFRKAVITWGLWVDKKINPHKTQVFFRSSAPSHFRGGQWNSGGQCTKATRPLNGTLRLVYDEKNAIVADIIKQMKTPVTFLNITSLSEFRIDGHPSLYGKSSGKQPGIQDCSHWCLPGVPDTWNNLLYLYLQSEKANNFP